MQTVALTEDARAASLESYGILDTPPEDAFDDITRMAMMVCRTPVAVINLIGAERQWFKSGAGLDLGDLPFLSSIFAHTTQGS
ncbi:MAG: sensor domain-containing diguanylate cyclase, partial [Tepidiformaceae bacterium]